MKPEYILMILNNSNEIPLFTEYLYPFKKFQTERKHSFSLRISREEIMNMSGFDFCENFKTREHLFLTQLIRFDWEESFGKVTHFSNTDDLYIMHYLMNIPLYPRMYEINKNFNNFGFIKGESIVSNIEKEIFEKCQIRNVITPDGTFWNLTQAEFANGRTMGFHEMLCAKDFIHKNPLLKNENYHPIEDTQIWPLSEEIIEENWKLLPEYFLGTYKDCHAILLKWQINDNVGKTHVITKEEMTEEEWKSLFDDIDGTQKF